MHRSKKASSAPSSSSSLIDDSLLKHDIGGSNFFKSRGGWGSNRQLTRQRKLRHVTDHEIGMWPSDRSQSLPVSPNSTSGSRSPTGFNHWSSSAVPQPLPVPELSLLMSQKQGLLASNSGPPSSSAFGINSAHQTIRKTTDHVATKSAKSPTNRRRMFPRDLNIESDHYNFRPNFPARSAPASGLSSPALSPRRLSTSDLFPSSYAGPLEFQGLSALEVPALDRLAGFSSHVSPKKAIPSPDLSPLQSPTIQSPHLNAKSPSGVASPLHHRLLPECSMAWPEGNSHANMHPLPLPPGASLPSQSAIIHHYTEKPDVSSMMSQWQKGKLIGRGTFGSVYVATNRETGALCAMKEVELIHDDPKSAECIKQLEQEIKVLRHLKHPNIVQYYGSEIVEDHLCIYLEYVHPGSINKYVREHCRAITESVVRNFTRHILSGLAYLHSTKTIHRDIKGANLLVDASGVVKLADFGMAKFITGQAAELSLKGSPYWMAPEVIQAAMQKDTNPDLAFAVDIWSLGCTIIEMLNGKAPWSEFGGVAAMFKVLHKSPPIPETLSSEGKDFLRRCFRRDPAERPSAVMLLEHPFIHSHDQNVSLSTQAISGMQLVDRSYNPRDWVKHKIDLMTISPGTLTRKGKLPPNGETCQQSYPETSYYAAVSHPSPRYTLEALPSLSTPQFNCSSHNISSSSNVSNSMHPGSGNNCPYALKHVLG